MTTLPASVLTTSGTDATMEKDITAMLLRALILAIISLLSLIGNAVVIIIILRHYQLRTVTNAFIASLSASDLLRTILCVPFTFATLFTNTWIFSNDLCVLNGFLNSLFGIASTLTLTLISIDRFYAIVKLPREKVTRTRAIQMMVYIWVQAFIFSFPWYIVDPQPRYYKDDFLHCMYIFHSTSSYLPEAYSIFVIVVCYLIPFTIMCYCYYNIWKTLRLSDTRIRPATAQASMLRFYGEMRTATTVLIMIFLFLCCWGPYCVMAIVVAGRNIKFNSTMDTIAMYLAWSNSAMNPVIYAIRNPHVSALIRRNRESGYVTGANNGVVIVVSPAIKRKITSISTDSYNQDNTPNSPRLDPTAWARKAPALMFCHHNYQPEDSTSVHTTMTQTTSL
ncbi:G-protein coupled receptor 135-like [Saccoglossus kowalevskii]|uniref:Probable G-protein coupled receptor 135-like n=1 Tax=Saccoglossus kowalevskii TaxID=10224 RepID=A0ABM0H0F7_SACKO|nr:PREDICTED: probable G-protein coupled receptor 135-like [Saccoglossus kowalevskii]